MWSPALRASSAGFAYDVMGSPPRVLMVQPALNVVSETFIRMHAQMLSGVVSVIHHNEGVPWSGDGPVLAQDLSARAQRKLGRFIRRKDWNWEIQSAYVSAIKQSRADVVLAQYGTTGVMICDACRKAGVPMVVHFHGFDASRSDVLERNSVGYANLFNYASAVICVSRAMEQRLIAIGCPREKLIYGPYGIDCNQFQGAQPVVSPPTFVGVGRFVEKKAAYLTLVAFSQIQSKCQDACLRLIGDGPLLGVCRDLAKALEIKHAVTFLGSQSQCVVQHEMRRARAFVQHSVTASSGDAEGTPVAVLEAGAMGLPVIATRHAGIPDVVVEGKTGLLVDERDVSGMAIHMIALACDPQLAGRLGSNAAAHVREYYPIEKSVSRLHRVLSAAACGKCMVILRQEIEEEFPSAPVNEDVATKVLSG
jgi:colanic acid/amylovoran biosynthesis glycosyltransferase